MLLTAIGSISRCCRAGYGGPTQKADFSYDKAGQTTQLQRSQGASSAARTGFGYDNQGRLASLSHLQPGASSLAQIARYDMAYDAANRITRIDSSVDEASVYTYDKTGQLTAAQMTFENNEAYAYDSNGNRTSGDTKSNGAHKNLIVQDAKYSFEYDGENNRTKRLEKATGNYQEYVWDHRNRLQEVRFKTATGVLTKTVKYFYDASDMKVREEVIAGTSNVVKYFVYDGGNVVLDFVDTDGHATGTAPTLDKRYFQGPGVDQLLTQENVTQAATVANRVWWVLPDHLGSTRDLVTGGGTGAAAGYVVAHFQYDSFGVILDGRENVTRYQFTGREHDSNTDLNYHRARWYDPLTGKWMSEDPIGFEAGDANVTRHVGNGVLNATDPSGHKVLKLLVDLPSSSRVVFAAIETGKSIRSWLNNECASAHQLPMTPDQTKFALMASGNILHERKVASILNYLEHDSARDYGFSSATWNYYSDIFFGTNYSDPGWCQTWVTDAEPSIKEHAVDGFVVTRVEFDYTGPEFIYTGHAAIRFEIKRQNQGVGIAYVDNGWKGGADFILFQLDKNYFGNEHSDDYGQYLSDMKTLAPHAAPPLVERTAPSGGVSPG